MSRETRKGFHERRRFLGLLATGGLVGVAGCSVSQEGDESGGGSGDSGSGGSSSGDSGSGGDDSGGSGGSESDSSDSGGLDSVVVGNPTNETGQFSWVNASGDKAYDIAVEEINEAGGPLGADVEVVRRDTALNPQKARQVTSQMLNSDDAVVVNGLGSGEITTNFEWIQDQGVSVISGVAGTGALREQGGDGGTPDDMSDDEWVWRTVAGDNLTVIGTATKAIEDGNTKMGFFSGTDPTNSQATDTLIDLYEDMGGEVVERIGLEQGQSSFQPAIDRMPWDEIDAFWIAYNTTDGIAFMRQWAQSDAADTLGYLQEWAFNEKFTTEMGDLLEGTNLITQTPLPENPRQQALESKFKDRFDIEWLPLFCSTYYDTVNVAMLALHASGETGSLEAQRTAIQQNIRSVTTPPGTKVTTFGEGKEALEAGEEINYQGAGSTCDFTQHGNVFTPIAVFDISADGFEQIQTLSESTLQDRVGENY